MNERVALYWASLYSAALEESISKEVYDSLKVAESVIEDNYEYVRIVSSANLSSDERVGLIEEAFSGKIHIFVLNFMKMLAKKRIFEIFIPCVLEYEKQYLKDNNISRAVITTAFELSEERKANVVEKIKETTGKTVMADFVVDESIVGGIIIETENSAIDASLAGKLQSIKRYISKN